MQDEFLTAFTEQRRLRAERDRSFDLEGVTLTHKAAVAPEAVMRFQDLTDELATWAEEVNRLIMQAQASKNGQSEKILAALPDQPVSDMDALRIYDDVVLSCLEPQSHEAWQKLRAVDAPYPLLGEEVYRIAVYLIGKTTQLPTVGLLGSSPTQPETEPTSKASSPSRARKPKTSAPSS